MYLMLVVAIKHGKFNIGSACCLPEQEDKFDTMHLRHMCAAHKKKKFRSHWNSCISCSRWFLHLQLAISLEMANNGVVVHLQFQSSRHSQRPTIPCRHTAPGVPLPVGQSRTPSAGSCPIQRPFNSKPAIKPLVSQEEKALEWEIVPLSAWLTTTWTNQPLQLRKLQALSASLRKSPKL